MRIPIVVALLIAGLLLAARNVGPDGRAPATATASPSVAPVTEPTAIPTPAVRTEPPAGEHGVVRSVVDGDTIVLADGRVVRYIGVDAPETGGAPFRIRETNPQGTPGGRRRRGCLADEATERNRALVADQDVRLESDTTETDRYGRLLRYVYVGNTLVNETLVREGFAQARPYPPDVRYADRFTAAEAEARSAGRGLWGLCQTTVRGLQATEHVPRTRERSAPADDRDCADFASRSDAQAFFESQGGPAHDSHNLDQDRDGRACESLR